MFHVKHKDDGRLEIQSTDWSQLFVAQNCPYDSTIWQEISAPWELLAKTADLIRQTASKRRLYEGPRGLLSKDVSAHSCHIEAGVFIHPECELTLGDSVRIESGVRLSGLLSLGSHSTIRHGAYLRDLVLTGENCVLGHNSEFKNATLHDGAKAAHFAYIGDSILGSRCNLGAGTKVSNLKVTGTDIVIPYQGGRIYTARRKFGAILGDHVETGCNTVLNPGCVLGKNSIVYPCLALNTRIYEANSWIKSNQKTLKREYS